MADKDILLIGYGYVGKSVANLFKDYFQVNVYDPHVSSDNCNFPIVKDNKEKKWDLAIVCVPTPMKEDGEVDTSIVEKVVSETDADLFLVKSTIPPGTTDKLKEKTGKRIVFSPEYIGEGKYVTRWWAEDHPHPSDMKMHSFQIFGGDKKDTSEVLQYFKKIYGPSIKLMQTDSKTAELCKYMANSWGATKVIFCNEFADIAEKCGVDYDELRELFLLDGRVERPHTAVFKDKRGFGGKCFPKDVNGIVNHMEKAGGDASLLKAVLKTNEKYRDSNK